MISPAKIRYHAVRITRAAIKGRQRSCAMCPNRCEAYKMVQIDHANEAAACPLPVPRWISWPQLLERQEARKMGLGDAVATMAKPIAKGLDFVAGTDLQNCAGCGKRQASLNEFGRKVKRAIKRHVG